MLDQVKVPWMIGVGAAFDYHAGTVPWAPKWMHKLGLEWLFIIITQPHLRMTRYVRSISFILLSVVKVLSARLIQAIKLKG